ncbi:MAG: GNAT family N-acetyltransferase [Caldilineaceae bacterium]
MTLIDRIQAQLHASARQNYAAVNAPPFIYYFNPDTALPWSNYAIPNQPVSSDLQEALAELVTAFQARERLPRLEYIEEFAPLLTAELVHFGFTEEMRALLMVCTPTTYRVATTPEGVEFRLIDWDESLPVIQAALTVQRRAFGEADAPETPLAEADQFRQRFRTSQLFVADYQGQIVSVATLQPPHAGITEIAGIATLPTVRRRGIATALTAHAVAAAFAQGLDAVSLTAGSAEAGRVYTNAGFVTIGSGLAYSLPTQ